MRNKPLTRVLFFISSCAMGFEITGTGEPALIVSIRAESRTPACSGVKLIAI
ncbi:hypothetical protein [Variovorax atrisoli]|uniref:hypothetical protein n=1 Tax=Variovorax atrisoli TaxID=3394203 RepID=UPI0013DF9CDC|nr:hypothetical protein [Variovorax sp. 369]